MASWSKRRRSPRTRRRRPRGRSRRTAHLACARSRAQSVCNDSDAAHGPGSGAWGGGGYGPGGRASFRRRITAITAPLNAPATIVVGCSAITGPLYASGKLKAMFTSRTVVLRDHCALIERGKTAWASGGSNVTCTSPKTVEKFAFARPRFDSWIQLFWTVALPLASVVVVVTCHTLYVPDVRVRVVRSLTSTRTVDVALPAVRV